MSLYLIAGHGFWLIFVCNFLSQAYFKTFNTWKHSSFIQDAWCKHETLQCLLMFRMQSKLLLEWGHNGQVATLDCNLRGSINQSRGAGLSPSIPVWLSCLHIYEVFMHMPHLFLHSIPALSHLPPLYRPYDVTIFQRWCIFVIALYIYLNT